MPLTNIYHLSWVADTFTTEAAGLVRNWLLRGDRALVYENQELGHPDAGSHTVVSYGGPTAQLEMTQFLEEPETLPDIGGNINWRYQLVGEVADLVDWFVVATNPTVFDEEEQIVGQMDQATLAIVGTKNSYQRETFNGVEAPLVLMKAPKRFTVYDDDGVWYAMGYYDEWWLEGYGWEPMEEAWRALSTDTGITHITDGWSRTFDPARSVYA